ncbi:MAG: NAD(P)H-dependent oxidoreductase [Chloroflexi bacterium]|nr:NAD(P)H-dependent oxidoreductase [Chloroflexota bacterium]
MTEQLAHAVADGAREITGVAVVLKNTDSATHEELLAADAIILGSPNWNGVTGKFKEWLDGTGQFWEDNPLVGRVGAAFTSGWSRSAGLEFTLWSLLHVLLAHGMIVVGLPWSDTMRSTGSYYGASAVGRVRPTDVQQARRLGRRVAEVTRRLFANGGDRIV